MSRYKNKPATIQATRRSFTSLLSDAFVGDDRPSIFTEPSMALWLVLAIITAAAIAFFYWYYKRAGRRDKAILNYNHADELFRRGRLNASVVKLNAALENLDSVDQSDARYTAERQKLKPGQRLDEELYSDLCLKSSCYHLRARAVTDGVSASADFPLTALTSVVSDHQRAIRLREYAFHDEQLSDPSCSSSTLASYHYYYGFALERANRGRDAVGCYQKVLQMDPTLTFLPTLVAKTFQERIDGIQSDWKTKTLKSKEQKPADKGKDESAAQVTGSDSEAKQATEGESEPESVSATKASNKKKSKKKD